MGSARSELSYSVLQLVQARAPDLLVELDCSAVNSNLKLATACRNCHAYTYAAIDSHQC